MLGGILQRLSERKEGFKVMHHGNENIQAIGRLNEVDLRTTKYSIVNVNCLNSMWCIVSKLVYVS